MKRKCKRPNGEKAYQAWWKRVKRYAWNQYYLNYALERAFKEGFSAGLRQKRSPKP